MFRINKVWIVCLIGLMIANLVFLNKSFVGWILTIGYFLLVPGYLLLQLITQEIKDQWEVASFSLGLSILVLILGGLLLNSMHAFGIQRPLTTWNIFITLDGITALLLLLNRSISFNLQQRLPHPSKDKIVMFVALTLLPLLAIGGAVRLNNGASNILTMILFGSIALNIVILFWRKNMKPLYPYAIIMIGLSVLFSTSLRGWGITGHDIQREFYVFQLTSQHSFWDITAFRNPYNACLSITILPTIFAKITHISDPYVYKVVFQIIFAIGLLPIYLFVRRLRDERSALSVGLIFISFPTFLNDMPFLNRQEIAFVFFSLLLLVNFLNIARRSKNILTILFLVGLILSHYSSAYITLGLLIVAWIFYKLTTFKISSSKHKFHIPLLSIPIILIALLFTFFWNSQITTTTAGLKETISTSLQDLLDHSSAYAVDTSYSLLGSKTHRPTQLLSALSGGDKNQVSFATNVNIPSTALGRLVSKVVSVETLNRLLRSFCAKILQVLVLLGLLILISRSRKNKPSQHQLYFIALSISCLILLLLQTLLPQISLDYGTLRFFQQALIILGIPIIVALTTYPRIFRKNNALVVTLLCFLFLDLSGFVPQILGGFPPQLTLNNNGFYYGAYYVHKSDLLTYSWLDTHIRHTSEVRADDFSKAKAEYQNYPFYQTGILPFQIKKGQYIMLNYTDVRLKKDFTYVEGTPITIELPLKYYDSNFSLIFSSGQTRVY